MSNRSPRSARYEVMGQELVNPPRWYQAALGLVFVWLALLISWGFGPDRLGLPAEVGRALPVLATADRYWSVALVIFSVVTMVGGLLGAVLDRNWSDALATLGFLGAVGAIVLVLFLIGGWDLLSKVDINLG